LPAWARSTYTCDGDGLRHTAHDTGGPVTRFFWDGDDYLLEKADAQDVDDALYRSLSSVPR
jgi:YD repeat-containing protein